MVEHHEFVIKPSFDEGLARKIPLIHVCDMVVCIIIPLAELRSEMDESESKAAKVLRKVSYIVPFVAVISSEMN